jgi:hypothetical protein
VNYKGFKIAGLAVMILILCFSWSISETLISKEENATSISGYFDQIDYQSSQQLYSLTQSDSVGKPKPNIDIYHFKGKSTKRGFLYSLILPGAGEFYAGSKIKAVLFVGLEAAFWTGYFTNHKKGKNKETEFINFADVHWNEKKYRDSLLVHYGVVIDTPGTFIVSIDTLRRDTLVIGETLPSSKDQQYYEMIGKYEQFRFGWDDYNAESYYQDRNNYKSPNRAFYLDLRFDSNSLLEKANRFVMVSLANHLLSAFDAALAVRSHNRKGEKFSTIDVKLRLAEYNKNEIIPKLTVSTKF